MFYINISIKLRVYGRVNISYDHRILEFEKIHRFFFNFKFIFID